MTRRLWPAFALLAACSSSSSSPSAPDASADAPPADAGHEASPFPTEDSGGQPDSGSECDQLKTRVTALGLAARKCNPQGASECGAATDGICCQITVSISSTQAVNDFDQAVKTYKAKCTPDCSKVICQQVPSGVCDGTGSSGICQ